MHSRAGLADPNGLGKHSSELAFFQRAREFALLARAHVEKSHLSLQEWDDLIKNLPEEPLKNSGEYLATFDQTGMDHVAELMLALEHLDLN